MNSALFFRSNVVLGVLAIVVGSSLESHATASTSTKASTRVSTESLLPPQTHATQQPIPVPAREKLTRFAVIGDYGTDSIEEADVAALVHAFTPEFVLTVGDDNYPAGDATTIDTNIGKHYHDFIGAYSGAFGAGAAQNRFFPTLGNHDWVAPNAAPYLAYFTLPGNERYYDFVRGPVHFFAIDSDVNEPDGVTATSVQAQWLQQRLAASTEPFKVVYFHHPPWSSGAHGPTPDLQWPFRAWGADIVLTGHDHLYERVVLDGFPYIVDGLGGAPKYAFGPPVAGSVVRYNQDHGALFVEATNDLMTLRFVSRAGFVQDMFQLRPNGVAIAPTTFVAAGSTWKYKDDGSNQGTAWIAPNFADSSWAQGPAQLGYGDGDEATVVNGGPSGAHFTTTYFRRSFQVADPSLVTSLALEIVRDDGAVVYLNGVEVFRDDMPAGTITFTTLASAAISGTAESTFYSASIPPSALVAGTNVLAVEIHQAAPTSTDISFDLKLSGTQLGPKLVAKGAAWKYVDSGVFPGATWTKPTFDDSTWSQGPAQLGYGDGDEATVLSFGNDPNHKPITTWFRKSFNVATAPNFNALLLRCLRDDGIAVYLNGVEVFRQNVPNGPLAPDATSEYAVAGTEESTFVETHVDPRLLVLGTNVIAVEIHQESATTPDASFDLELIGL